MISRRRVKGPLRDGVPPTLFVLRLAAGLSVPQLCALVGLADHEEYRYYNWERDNGISTRKWRERIMARLDPRHTVPSLWRDPYATMRGRSKVPLRWLAKRLDVAQATLQTWLSENYIPDPKREEEFRTLCQLYKAPRGIRGWRLSNGFTHEQMAALVGVKPDEYRLYEETPWDIGEREYDRVSAVLRMTHAEAVRTLSVLRVAKTTRRRGAGSFTNPKDRAKEEV